MAYFYVFCSRPKDILTKLVGYQQRTCLCVKMKFVVGTISLLCELFFSGAVFVYVRSAQSCAENILSISHVQRCGSCMVSTHT